MNRTDVDEHSGALDCYPSYQCPGCDQELTKDGNLYECHNCKRAWPVSFVANGMLPQVTDRDTVEVSFRGGPAFDNGKTRQLHVSKCDGEEFITSGGSVMGDAVPDRVHVYKDGEAHFVRWAH